VKPHSGAASRVCELYVREPDRSGWRSGSGTLVSSGVVLTAGHVGQLGAEVVVRPLRGGEDHAGTVVWSGADCGADAALVRVPALGAGHGGAPELRWGRLVCEAPGAPVEAVGFPWTRLSSRDGWRDTEELVGSVRPMGLAKAGLIDVAVESAPRDRGESEPPPWSGMSGAGLFCNQVLIGVVCRADLPMGSRRVRAVPVSDFADDHEFSELVWPGGEEAYPGLEPAELTGLQQRAEPPSSPASLLRADAEVVPFHGRQKLLGRLHDWCAGEGRSAYLLTGPGGQGKTRLARHFASELRRDGWATVILGSSMDQGDVGWLSSVQVPLLIVIDYAEQRKDDLKLLGRALAALRPDAKLRVLLLARGAGEWRETLRDGWDFAVTSIPTQTAELGPLDEEPEGRRVAFGRAVSAFAGRLRQLPEFVETTDSDWAAREAAAAPPAFQPTATALDMQLTALVGLLQTGQQSPATDPAAAATYLLGRHEASYWDRIAGQHALELHPVNRRAAVAAACLLPAADRQQALAILARVPGIGGLNNDRLTAIASWLRDLYPASRQFWGSLQPDMLAEHLVAQAVKEQENLLLSLLERVDGRQASQALTVIARAAARYPVLGERVVEVIRAHPDILGPTAVRVALEVTEHRLLADALSHVVEDHSDQLGLLRAIYDSIPYPTQVHGQLAVTVADHLVTALRPRVPPRWDRRPVRRPWARGRHGPGRGLAEVRDLARALSALSVRHQAIGSYDDALRAGSEAVKMCEGLVRLEPEAFLADLAASLNNMANCLDELNRRPEALAARRRAETEYRRLAGRLPEAFGHADDRRRFADLATVLNNLATDLPGPEGVAMAEESVQICRQLTAADEAFNADLARSLNTLSVGLSESGRSREALQAVSQALELYEPLSETQLDTYLPRLTASYNNLTRYLVELGETRMALEASGKAVARYRRLTRSHPGIYRPVLAGAYRNQSDRMAELGRPEDALLANYEAIKLYRGLTNERPGAFAGDLVRCLRIHSAWLREAGRPRLAEEADAEADEWNAPGYPPEEPPT
jgi:tetratricopeptide (TPR) repeat protein